MFQNAFINLVEGEKSYNNLLFLNLKSINKIGVKFFFLCLIYLIDNWISIKDRYFESALVIFDQILKDANANRIKDRNNIMTIIDINNSYDLVTDLVQFIEFRFIMMNL